MSALNPGARRLPTHHVTIRLPWHDGGWSGSVCARPLENTSCLILGRIGEGKRDEVETRCAGKRLDELAAGDLPPCTGERVSFMAPFELSRTMNHPYVEAYPETHGHFAPTRFVEPAYTAACVPLHGHNVTQRDFRSIAERLGLPHIRFHDLRHSCATMLLRQGVHPKVVAEQLGHASIGITMDTYSHVVPALMEEAASVLATRLIGSGTWR